MCALPQRSASCAPTGALHPSIAPASPTIQCMQHLHSHLRVSTLALGRRTRSCRSITDEILSRGDPAPDDRTTAAELTRLHRSGAITKDRVQSEVVMTLLAGSETTSSTMHSVLQLLAQNPEWQDRIEEELHAAGGAGVGRTYAAIRGHGRDGEAV